MEEIEKIQEKVMAVIEQMKESNEISRGDIENYLKTGKIKDVKNKEAYGIESIYYNLLYENGISEEDFEKYYLEHMNEIDAKWNEGREAPRTQKRTEIVEERMEMAKKETQQKIEELQKTSQKRIEQLENASKQREDELNAQTDDSQTYTDAYLLEPDTQLQEYARKIQDVNKQVDAEIEKLNKELEVQLAELAEELAFEQDKAKRIQEIDDKISAKLDRMTEEQIYDFGEANEEITKMKLEQDKIAAESYEEFKAKKKELEEKKAKALEEAKKEHEEFIIAKQEYKNLKKEKQDVTAKLELQKQEHEKSTLLQQREQLNAEIEKLKAKGKNEKDPEYREYLSDLEKINKELASKDNEIDETETKLSNIDNRMNELEEKYGKEMLEKEDSAQPEKKPEPTNSQQPAPQKPEPVKPQQPVAQKPEPIKPQQPRISNPVPVKSQQPISSKQKLKIVREKGTLIASSQEEPIFGYEISAKGIFYNGVLQEEEELAEICDNEKFSEKLEDMLGVKADILNKIGDSFIIAAIIKDESEEEAIRKLEAYANLLYKPNSQENNISIKYDLTGTSFLSRLTKNCKLSRDVIEYAKDKAYECREISEVKTGPITALKFKIRDMIEKSKTLKLDKGKTEFDTVIDTKGTQEDKDRATAIPGVKLTEEELKFANSRTESSPTTATKPGKEKDNSIQI